ncbi:MAG TPA: hypothetical protein VHZ25_10095 [Acidobacteriaceae bacterium]|jgi:hypothetical protein|nr:hypothetical protein [Acidobacteriaceae bacterium]
MKLRKDAVTNPEPDASRGELREVAEAVSLYRSAMHHIADREAARPFVADRRPARTFSLRLLLAPALTAVVAAGIFVPVYNHLHHHGAGSVAQIPAPEQLHASANVDDTALMNQIDSQLSEEVPDALRPLADLSDQSTTHNSSPEKNNVTQE